MEELVEKIPVSLHKKLSDSLVNTILDAKKKDSVPTDTAKRIIYLWRQDQLATPNGLATLIDAAVMADAEGAYKVLDELGLNAISVALKA
jgi:hypothetical protein